MSVEIVDTYDKQCITATFADGRVCEINFRLSQRGIIYNTSDTDKIHVDDIRRINEKLKDSGIFNHRVIGGHN